MKPFNRGRDIVIPQTAECDFKLYRRPDAKRRLETLPPYKIPAQNAALDSPRVARYQARSRNLDLKASGLASQQPASQPRY
ncbi:hypothetical protein CLCR_02193 [Cladophialophora carrionii]|uniref:Uncharacterized protein n=1 Tax=Cladophialophora carrionii TaxID=86049 RepID=A0A1C1CDP6_9EURO|nr:hypothetical protein CLCR_02193 [Cladophialophora carrionii]